MMIPLFIVASLLATCHGSDHGREYQIYPLRMKTGVGIHYPPNISCNSWRLGVEAHNIIDWATVPKVCEDYIGNYMLGEQYRSDSKTVCQQAYFYARSLNLSPDGKNVWIFDVDDTCISSLPYYAEHGFGVEPYNPTAWTEWVFKAVAPQLPETFKLYNKLLSLGIKPVFLTGRNKDQWNVTALNLKRAGYHTWEKLIVRDSYYAGKTAVVYKSAQRKKLEEGGYRIIGNIGDQWSDLLGTNPGYRTFKLPDPLYYIA